MPTREDLKYLQAMPLDVKIKITMQRIREFVNYFGEDGVYISFSGGKDSTVLLNIIRNRMKLNIPAVFINTGLEYPEIVDFVRTFENVIELKPSMNFKQVVMKYGYPFISKEVSNNVDGARKYMNALTDRQTDRQTDFRMPATTEEYAELANTIQRDLGKTQGSPQRLAIMLGMWSKNKTAIVPNSGERSKFSMEKYKFFLDAPFNLSEKCCNVMKKSPAHKYEKETGRLPITATTAEESRLRTQKWVQYGCNLFEGSRAKSNPMSFWTEQDILLYIKENNLPICSVYGEIVSEDDDGMEYFDAIGVQRLKTSKLNRTGCMFCGFGAHLERGEGRFEKMKKSHPKQYEWIMKPVSEGGLGYKEIIDWMNENGNLNIKY